MYINSYWHNLTRKHLWYSIDICLKFIRVFFCFFSVYGFNYTVNIICVLFAVSFHLPNSWNCLMCCFQLFYFYEHANSLHKIFSSLVSSFIVTVVCIRPSVQHWLIYHVKLWPLFYNFFGYVKLLNTFLHYKFLYRVTNLARN